MVIALNMTGCGKPLRCYVGDNKKGNISCDFFCNINIVERTLSVAIS